MIVSDVEFFDLVKYVFDLGFMLFELIDGHAIVHCAVVGNVCQQITKLARFSIIRLNDLVTRIRTLK